MQNGPPDNRPQPSERHRDSINFVCDECVKRQTKHVTVGTVLSASYPTNRTARIFHGEELPALNKVLPVFSISDLLSHHHPR